MMPRSKVTGVDPGAGTEIYRATKTLYDTFLGPAAPMEVNVGMDSKKFVQKALESGYGYEYCFDQAEEDARHMLEHSTHLEEYLAQHEEDFKEQVSMFHASGIIILLMGISLGSILAFTGNNLAFRFVSLPFILVGCYIMVNEYMTYRKTLTTVVPLPSKRNAVLTRMAKRVSRNVADNTVTASIGGVGGVKGSIGSVSEELQSESTTKDIFAEEREKYLKIPLSSVIRNSLIASVVVLAVIMLLPNNGLY